MSRVLTTLTPNGVFQITLDRPEKRNALDTEMWRDLLSAIDQCESDSAACAVVLTGAPPVFCAGADLRSVPLRSSDGVMRATERLDIAQEVIRRIYRLPVVTIAAVEGAAAGVGWSLALACDFILAGESCRFLAPFVKLGLVPDGGFGWQIVRAVGYEVALELLFLRGEMGAREAERAGLVQRVVSDGSALSEAIELSQAVQGPPETIALTKRLVRQAASRDLETYLDLERDMFLVNAATGRPAERVGAYLDSID